MRAKLSSTGRTIAICVAADKIFIITGRIMVTMQLNK